LEALGLKVEAVPLGAAVPVGVALVEDDEVAVAEAPELVAVMDADDSDV